MAASPVETLVAKNHSPEEDVTSNDKMAIRRLVWMLLCVEMETLLNNYKAEVRNKKHVQRELKWQQEREILTLFKQETEGLVRKKWQERMNIKKTDLQEQESGRESLNTPYHM